KVCCEKHGDCKIYDLEYSRSECNEKGEFYLKVTFKFQNTSDSFDITDSLRKKYGRFAFTKLPILIGPIKGDCNTINKIKIIDYKNEKCNLVKEIGIVCCQIQGDCKLDDLKIEKSECNDHKEFYVTLNFNHINTSDCFTVQGNGVNYGTFNYADLPIKIGPLKGNCETDFEFVIRDCHNEKCAIDGRLGKVCCETQGDCKLSEFKIEKSTCDEKKEFYVTLNFKHDNTSDCFTVQGNGVNYGTFNYADLPINIGPLKGNCETNYEFQITDCQNENCTFEVHLGKVCCETQGDCKLDDLKIEKSECNDHKEFYVTLNFNHNNTSDCFTVQGNGVNYGTFNYADLPIKIGPLKGNCETNYEFVIRDCHNEKCAIDGSLGKVCCETQGDCKLSELKIEKSTCKENKEFYVTINFKHVNTSDCFTVKGNGVNYGTFNYADLPIKIGPLKGNCETNYEFVIRDCQNENCAVDGSIGKVCCETQGHCEIGDLILTRTECDKEGNFYVKLNFKYANVSECFVVRQNDHIIGKFTYANLPVLLGPFKGDCHTEYIFTVWDCQNEQCAAKALLGKVCCGTQGGDCKLSDLKIEKSTCNENKEFYVTINFNHVNTSDCFTVKGNGVNYGTFNYADLPIKIGPLKGNCETNYEFVIRDCKNENCAIDGIIGKVCCETQGHCEIGDLILTRTECDREGNFYVKLNFKYANVSECFVVRQNDHIIGKFPYTNLPILLGPFKGDCTTEYIFTVWDCLDEHCTARALLGKVCCATQGDCKLSELKIEKTPCDQKKLFYVTLNFNHQNTSDCFMVQGNGINYGTFKYSQLPLKIGPLKGNCETNYEFVIRDCEDEHCALEAHIGKVCCETLPTDCMLSDLEIVRLDCNAEGLFYVKLNFKYKNVSECFVVRQNNNIIGKFKYASLPLQLGPFKGDCTTNYIFTITDCAHERCSLRKEIGRV
ncbi:MAG: hypothetical protein ABIO44_12735, partial [Saprospiraceae bacterium]